MRRARAEPGCSIGWTRQNGPGITLLSIWLSLHNHCILYILKEGSPLALYTQMSTTHCYWLSSYAMPCVLKNRLKPGLRLPSTGHTVWLHVDVESAVLFPVMDNCLDREDLLEEVPTSHVQRLVLDQRVQRSAVCSLVWCI